MYELNQNQINLIVGYKINELISVVGITPTELAAATKLDLNSLEAFLSGGRKLSSAETQKIVDVLKAEISDIFAFSNHRQRHPDINGYATGTPASCINRQTKALPDVFRQGLFSSVLHVSHIHRHHL